jgi:hypothetical protein
MQIIPLVVTEAAGIQDSTVIIDRIEELFAEPSMPEYADVAGESALDPVPATACCRAGLQPKTHL